MATITIDDELYEYIASKTKHIGEDASSILRRLLGLPRGNEPVQDEYDRQSSSDGAAALLHLTRSPSFLAANSTNRFLMVLSQALRERPALVDSLSGYKARKRVYFAKSRQEIEASGQNCSPRRIPESEWWVMCNANNPQKREMLSKALKILGYDFADADRVAAATIR